MSGLRPPAALRASVLNMVVCVWACDGDYVGPNWLLIILPSPALSPHFEPDRAVASRAATDEARRSFRCAARGGEEIRTEHKRSQHDEQ